MSCLLSFVVEVCSLWFVVCCLLFLCLLGVGCCLLFVVCCLCLFVGGFSVCRVAGCCC